MYSINDMYYLSYDSRCQNLILTTSLYASLMLHFLDHEHHFMGFSSSDYAYSFLHLPDQFLQQDLNKYRN